MQLLVILLSIVFAMAVEGEDGGRCSRGSYQLGDFQCGPYVSRCQYWKVNRDTATAFCCHKQTSYCNALKIHHRAPTAHGCRCLGLELETIRGGMSEPRHADSVSSANSQGNGAMIPENAAQIMQHAAEQFQAPFQCVDDTTVEGLAELSCSLSSVALNRVAGYRDTSVSEDVLRVVSYLAAVNDPANTYVADSVVDTVHATSQKDSTNTDASSTTTSYDPSLRVCVSTIMCALCVYIMYV